MALMETLKENFNFGGRDTGKWDDPGSANVSIGTNLRLEITSSTSANYYTLSSTATYDLTGSSAFSQLIDAGNQAITSLEVYPVHLASGTNAVSIMISGNLVFARKKVGGVSTTVGSSIAYNSTTMQWFRIRESGGNTSWQYASDPSGSWTDITTAVANPITVTALHGEVIVGTWQAEGSTSTPKFDNFNMIPGENIFTWQKYNWEKRIHMGDPANNQTWSSANVGTPDASDYMTLTLSNAGSAPIGAEFYTVQRGFGYGVYTTVIGTRLDNLHAALAFGNMFTFDFTDSPAYREIDMGEVRPYNSNPNKRILYSHVWNNGGSRTFITDDLDQAADTTQTHVCEWWPGSINFKTYTGEGDSKVLLNTYTHTTNIPVPGLERVHFNIWVDTSIGSYLSTTAATVTIKKFHFTNKKFPSHFYSRQGFQ